MFEVEEKKGTVISYFSALKWFVLRFHPTCIQYVVQNKSLNCKCPWTNFWYSAIRIEDPSKCKSCHNQHYFLYSKRFLSPPIPPNILSLTVQECLIDLNHLFTLNNKSVKCAFWSVSLITHIIRVSRGDKILGIWDMICLGNWYWYFLHHLLLLQMRITSSSLTLSKNFQPYRRIKLI